MEDELKGALYNRGIEAGLCNNCKRKANLTNCAIRKERRGGRRREEMRKRMAFWGVKKPILIRPFLTKEYILFFNLF